MPGEELMARLRADPDLHQVPVVVLSADATRHHIARLKAAGAAAYPPNTSPPIGEHPAHDRLA